MPTISRSAYVPSSVAPHVRSKSKACSLFCFVEVEPMDAHTWRVRHGFDMQTFKRESYDEILAWIQALHFIGSSLEDCLDVRMFTNYEARNVSPQAFDMFGNAASVPSCTSISATMNMQIKSHEDTVVLLASMNKSFTVVWEGKPIGKVSLVRYEGKVSLVRYEALFTDSQSTNVRLFFEGAGL